MQKSLKRLSTMKSGVRLNEGVVIATLLGITFAIFIQVILRYVFLAPIMGLEEILGLVVVWLWFFSIAYAAYYRAHISGGMLSMRKGSGKKIFDVVKSVFCLSVTLLFCYFSYKYCWWTYTRGLESVSYRIPLIYGTVAALIGLMLSALYFVQELRSNMSAVRRRDEDTDSNER